MENMEHDALQDFARRVAPIVDRLAIAVHGHGHQEALDLLRAFGIPRAYQLLDARPLLMRGATTADDLAIFWRYADLTDAARALEELARDGWLTRDRAGTTTRYAPTERAAELLRQLTEAQSRTITALWAGHEHDLPALVAALTRVTDEAATMTQTMRYPAFHLSHLAPLPPDATAAYTLLARLTALKNLRVDAFFNTRSMYELNSPEIGVMTSLWRDGDSSRDLPSFLDEAMERLVTRGLVEKDGWVRRLTEAGRTMREEIEAETDRGAAPPWAALSASERKATFTNLEGLPY